MPVALRAAVLRATDAPSPLTVVPENQGLVKVNVARVNQCASATSFGAHVSALYFQRSRRRDHSRCQNPHR